jgi:hypothetical protein
MALRIHTAVFWVTTPHSLLPTKILQKHYLPFQSDSTMNVEAVWSSDMLVHIYQPLWCQPKLRIVPHNLQHAFQVGRGVTHYHGKDSWRDLPPLPNY